MFLVGRDRLLGRLKDKSSSLELKLRFIRSCIKDENLELRDCFKLSHYTDPLPHDLSNPRIRTINSSHMLHISQIDVNGEKIVYAKAQGKARSCQGDHGISINKFEVRSIPCPRECEVGIHGDQSTEHVSSALCRINDVYYVGACGLEECNYSASQISFVARGVQMKGRYARLKNATQLITAMGVENILGAATRRLVHFTQTDAKVLQIQCRRQHRTLRKCWSVISVPGGQSQAAKIQRQSSADDFGGHLKTSFAQCDHGSFSSSLDCASITSRGNKNANCLVGTVDRSVQVAHLAFRSTKLFVLRCSQLSRDLISASVSNQATEGAHLRIFLRAWRHCTHVTLEGRKTLVSSLIDNASQYQKFQITRHSNSGFCARFITPLDVEAVARIAYHAKTRRYCNAWRSRSSLLKEVTLKGRRRMTCHSRAHFRAWYVHTRQLQMARSLAHSKWCKYKSTRLSRPFRAWYLWVNARVLRQRSCDRIYFSFTRLRQRHVAAITLQAWKHNAELNRLEAKYTRRQLMSALAEQKAHVHMLERLADDHDLIHSELHSAAEVSHNRAAKLTRSVIICDDDCTNLESRLESVENNVALAGHLLSSVQTFRSALTQHILMMQPAVGFAEQDLSGLASERDARLCADGSSKLVKSFGGLVPRDSSEVCENHHKRGCEGGSKVPGFGYGGGDTTKRAFATRLSWLLNIVKCHPALVNFHPVTHVEAALLLKNLISASDNQAQKDCSHSRLDLNTCSRKKEPTQENFTALASVSLPSLENRTEELLNCLEEMYAVFEFLRDGNTSALPERLRALWSASICRGNWSSTRMSNCRIARPWGSTASKVPLIGGALKWSNIIELVTMSSPRGLSCQKHIDQLVRYIFDQQCYNNLATILYSGAKIRFRAKNASRSNYMQMPYQIRLWDSGIAAGKFMTCG